jgi:hypothetical protein
MSSENIRLKVLIALGVTLTQERAVLDARLHEVKDKIEHLFPCKKTHEILECEAGIAERTVRREHWIAPGSLAEVRRILGTAYAHLIDEEMPLTVTTAMRNLLRKDESLVAAMIKPHIIINTEAPIIFKQSLSEIMIGDEPSSTVVAYNEMFNGQQSDEGNHA